MLRSLCPDVANEDLFDGGRHIPHTGVCRGNPLQVFTGSEGQVSFPADTCINNNNICTCKVPLYHVHTYGFQ